MPICWDNSPGPIMLLCVVSAPANPVTTYLPGLDKQMGLPTYSAAKHMGKGKGKFWSKTKH